MKDWKRKPPIKVTSEMAKEIRERRDLPKAPRKTARAGVVLNFKEASMTERKPHQREYRSFIDDITRSIATALRAGQGVNMQREPMGPKVLTKEQLIAVLERVPDGSLILANTVGNLAVLDNESFHFIGYVDFRHEGEFIE